MKSSTIVKIIFYLFLISFISFLVWFFVLNKNENITSPIGNVKEQSFWGNFFPFGDNNQVIDKEKIEKKEQKKEEEKESKIIKQPQLRQISNIPTTGAVIEKLSKVEVFDLNKNRKSSNKLDLDKDYYEIRFVSAQNNHIYQSYNFTNQVKKLTNITIPKVFVAQFFNKNNYILRYSKDFITKTYMVFLRKKEFAEIALEKEKNKSKNINPIKFEGLFFPDNILNLAINNDSKKVFYLTLENKDRVEDGKVYGVLADWNGENKEIVFSNPFKEWNITFQNPRYITLSNKVSFGAKSMVYIIDVEKGTKQDIDLFKTALNVLPNYDFSKILYSYRDEEGKVKLALRDLKNNQSSDLFVSTFVEKCVWSQNNIDIYCAVPRMEIGAEEPDDWYMGKTFFRDDIVKINSENLMPETIFDSYGENKNFDIIDLKLDNSEKYLYWKDKKTWNYWSWDLAGE